MTTRSVLRGFCAVTAALLAGSVIAAGSGESTGEGRSAVQSMAPFTYFHEGDSALVAIDSAFARGHLQDEWIPLEIAVANKDLRGLTVDPQAGFWLKDPQGHVYRAAPANITARLRQADRFGARANPIALNAAMRQRFRVYSFVRPNFTRVSLGYSRAIPLPKRAWTNGVILFQNPGKVQVNKGWAITPGQRYELYFSAPELKEPMVVGFAFGP